MFQPGPGSPRCQLTPTQGGLQALDGWSLRPTGKSGLAHFTCQLEGLLGVGHTVICYAGYFRMRFLGGEGGLRGPQPLPSEGEGVSVSQSCPTLCNPVDCSSVRGILQARILKWGAIPFSRGSSQFRDGTLVSCIASRCFYHLSHQGRCFFDKLISLIN